MNMLKIFPSLCVSFYISIKYEEKKLKFFQNDIIIIPCILKEKLRKKNLIMAKSDIFLQ